MINKGLKRQDLLYPELSYQVIGVLFDVCNELGYGYQEKYYLKLGILANFTKKGLQFKRIINLNS